MQHKNYTVDTESMVFTFTDAAGEQFAHFKLNPTDPRIMHKCKDMATVFANAPETIKTHLQWEEFVEDKFCEFLGYDCKKSLFGRIAATDIMKDGRPFASHVIDVMIAHVGPEIKRRHAENLARHLGKYAE